MEFKSYIFLVIIGMFLVTFIPRIFPLIFFSKNKMNRELERFITYFPISILTCLVIKEIFFLDGRLSINLTNPNIIPALFSLIVAIKSRSIALTIASGIIAYSLISIFL